MASAAPIFFSVKIALTTVYISGDMSPNYCDGSGVMHGVLYATTTGYPAGMVNVDTAVTLTIYGYDDLSNYGTNTVQILSGYSCSYISISGFGMGAYISDWGPTTSPNPSSSYTQTYSNFLFTIGDNVSC